MTKLNIIYPQGRMTINLSQFLDTCGVTKFRKLLKVIELSDSAEEYYKSLRSYLENNIPVENTDIDNTIANYKMMLAAYEDKANEVKDKLYELKEVTKRTMKNGRRASQELSILKLKREELEDDLKGIRGEIERYRELIRSDKKCKDLINKRIKYYSRFLELLKDV